MYKILIIEDEERLTSLLKSYFEKEGYEVIIANNGITGIEKFKECVPHIILLDVMMPFMDGYDTCKIIRKDSNVPIIFFTAKSEDIDKLFGYNLGADDYITKPFSPKVLIAKVNALVNRVYNTDATNNIHIADGLIVDESSHRVIVNGSEILLTPTEYDLLLYFFNNKNIALTRDQILNSVWGTDYFGDTRTVDTNIKRLREKLKSKSHMISTIRGSGYRFEVE